MTRLVKDFNQQNISHPKILSFVSMSLSISNHKQSFFPLFSISDHKQICQILITSNLFLLSFSDHKQAGNNFFLVFLSSFLNF